jgi:hypothetical protein
MYFSVHSAAVKLGPAGIHVAHVMKYAGSERARPNEVEAELESYLDTVQPGWQGCVHTRRALPNMVVTHGVPLASRGGTQGRPDIRVSGVPRVFLAGDWVGPVGQIADASVASGEAAARLALAELNEKPRRHVIHA